MTDFIILAAGKGTRLKSNITKALTKVLGKPMICYILDSITMSRVSENVVIVVSPTNHDDIKKELKKKNYQFVIQNKQLGTGDAVNSVIKSGTNLNDNILVLLVDHPLISTKTIKKLNNIHCSEESLLSMVTAHMPNYKGIYSCFYHDGRIKRDLNNNIIGIIEPSDATKKDMEIKETNTSLYIFNKDWLIKNLSNVEINKKKNEYYLTDLIKIAVMQNIKINSISIDAKESVGINTKEDLAIVESLLKRRKK